MWIKRNREVEEDWNKAIEKLESFSVFWIFRKYWKKDFEDFCEMIVTWSKENRNWLRRWRAGVSALLWSRGKLRFFEEEEVPLFWFCKKRSPLNKLIIPSFWRLFVGFGNRVLAKPVLGTVWDYNNYVGLKFFFYLEIY